MNLEKIKQEILECTSYDELTDKLIGYYSEEERCFKSRKDIVEQGKTFL